MYRKENITILKRLIFGTLAWLVGVAIVGAAGACISSEIDVLGDGTQCETSKFELTTTSNTNKFEFYLSAAGVFYVDWGDDNVEVIDRTGNNGSAVLYTHTYASAGQYTIRFSGTPTAYHVVGNADKPAVTETTISFLTSTKTNVASISGSLGALFPTLNDGSAGTDQPRFYQTFKECSGLTSIPAGLFTGVTGSAPTMFRETFDRCSGITTVPDGLFDGVSGGAANMFRSTFYNCTGLRDLPNNLFAGVTSPAANEFKYTFYGTTGLAGKFIPPEMFAGLISAGHPTVSTMWTQTFDSSGFVTSCPDRMKNYITGYESSWGGKVSCEPSNACVGAEYYDPENPNAASNGCVACPTGYDDDLSNTKESIAECKIHCAGGTYLAHAGDSSCSVVGDGYYAGESTVAYGGTSSRTRCADNMPTNTQTASSASSCVVYCRGTNYRSTSTNTCVECPDGYTDDPADGKTDISDCKIHCEGGYYLAVANAPACSVVGDGYYAAESTVAYGSTGSRTQCPNDEKTGTDTATSSDQCQELCTGATYYDSTRDMCIDCPVGYNGHTLSGKTSINQCQIHCPAGTYLATAESRVCTNVGDGYYAAASNVNYGSVGTRQQCPPGQTTGTQTATDVSQCKTSCVGATYYDSDAGHCVACPTVYTDNTDNGKNSINQCQKHCAGGYYLDTYTPVEYIQGNGTSQYIDTGYSVQSPSSIHGTGVIGVETTFNGNTSGSDVGNFWGNMYGPGGFSSGFKYNAPANSGVFGVWMQPASGSGAKAQSVGPDNGYIIANTQYQIDFTLNISGQRTTATISVNGEQPISNFKDNAPFNGTGNSFKLFTNGSATVENNAVKLNYGDKLFKGRIYSFKLWDGNNLVFDLIPVRRNSDGAVGMYNRIDNTFYENSGTGGGFTAPNTSAGATYAVCSPVGDGYFSPASENNYGSEGVRYRCPNNTATNKNNATSIYECDGVEECTGATYPNASTGVCTACPQGYGDNTGNRKEFVSQCQIHCPAGAYLSTVYDSTCTNVGNGYYADESFINYGSTGIRNRCENGGATGTDTAVDETECLEPISDCEGATYMDSGVCVACPTGYTYNTIPGKVAEIDCQILCPEGSYLAHPGDTTCTDVGVGYWATGGPVNYGTTSVKNRCATGLTTVGYGHGADEVADCGRVLHVGNHVIYAKTIKDTTPAINLQMNGNERYYIGLSPTDHNLSKLHLAYNNQQYTAYDDGLINGERDPLTGQKIEQQNP